MTLATVSLAQGLSVWSDLEQAYYGDHRYGGDVAEVYAYRLMPHSPAGYPTTTIPSAWAQDERRRYCRNAAEALVHLVEFFMERRECSVLLDYARVHDYGLTAAEWRAAYVDGPHLFDHRTHLRVLR